MTSARKIEANRRNASRSTGPRTPDGKARASRNAFRHGLAAATVSLPTPSDDVLRLARAFAGPGAGPFAMEEGAVAARAELDLRLVKSMQHKQEEAFARLRTNAKPAIVLTALVTLINQLRLLNRYERAARARLNRAIAMLRDPDREQKTFSRHRATRLRPGSILKWVPSSLPSAAPLPLKSTRSVPTCSPAKSKKLDAGSKPRVRKPCKDYADPAVRRQIRDELITHLVDESWVDSVKFLKVTKLVRFLKRGHRLYRQMEKVVEAAEKRQPDPSLRSGNPPQPCAAASVPVDPMVLEQPAASAPPEIQPTVNDEVFSEPLVVASILADDLIAIRKTNSEASSSGHESTSLFPQGSNKGVTSCQVAIPASEAREGVTLQPQVDAPAPTNAQPSPAVSEKTPERTQISQTPPRVTAPQVVLSDDRVQRRFATKNGETLTTKLTELTHTAQPGIEGQKTSTAVAATKPPAIGLLAFVKQKSIVDLMVVPDKPEGSQSRPMTSVALGVIGRRPVTASDAPTESFSGSVADYTNPNVLRSPSVSDAQLARPKEHLFFRAFALGEPEPLPLPSFASVQLPSDAHPASGYLEPAFGLRERKPPALPPFASAPPPADARPIGASIFRAFGKSEPKPFALPPLMAAYEPMHGISRAFGVKEYE